jgi:phosphoribosylformylglycinamidine synthase
MIAGGLGNVRRAHVEKSEIPVGTNDRRARRTRMLIGLGGGAASSVKQRRVSADLDFASVQRGNPGDPAARAGSDRPLQRALEPNRSC